MPSRVSLYRGLVRSSFTPLLCPISCIQGYVCVVCITCFNFSPLGVKRSYSPPWSWVNEFICNDKLHAFLTGCLEGGAELMVVLTA